MGAECGTRACGEAFKNGHSKCSHSRRSSRSKSSRSPLKSRGPSSPVVDEDQEVRKFWKGLSVAERRRILRVDKKELFQRIRCLYCSRCYGLFQLRYEELRGSPPSDCPTCRDCYAGLVVGLDGALTLEDDIVTSDPFEKFREAKVRERERELQFMTGNICGSGWQKRHGQNMCSLHTTPVPCEALTEYWANLPTDHRSTLFSLLEDDFVADLDAHLKYQLKICRDCRSNVMRAFKDLKSGREEMESLELCKEHHLKVEEGAVKVEGAGGASFFELAEEIEENKIADSDSVGELSHSDEIRHAETPALAQEALRECAVLIFKSQAEVAFREQSAGHNALLLFVYLTLQIMEQNLMNAFRELSVKQAEAELLELLAGECVATKKSGKKSKNKKKKSAKPMESRTNVSVSSPDSTSAPEDEDELSKPPIMDVGIENVSTGLSLELDLNMDMDMELELDLGVEACKKSVLESSKLMKCVDADDQDSGKDGSDFDQPIGTAVEEDSNSDLGSRTGTDSLSVEDSVESVQVVVGRKGGSEGALECDCGAKLHLKMEEWPTLQESNSRMKTMKTQPGRDRQSDAGLPPKVEEFRFYNLHNSLKKHDSAGSLGKTSVHAHSTNPVVHPELQQGNLDTALPTQLQDGVVMRSYVTGQGKGEVEEGGEEFSLFHRFPGDYRLVNSPAGGGAVPQSDAQEAPPQQPEFTSCYTLFGKGAWTPLLSLFKYMPLSQLNK